ncbi:MAG: tRNA guanosine(15) transglycosylase TgtA [Candidatus Caldarchaeum sp.]|uniref:tRNA-guanine(15) transglycosylase n=1 Tax=Caldiarchaeum subterraneum TaxID=311458 RepID=A0A7C5LDX5_CALS0
MELEFEVKHKDLLGRVGVLTVAGKRVTTPAFVPVINPLNQVIPASDMKKELGCEIVITNSFIIYKRLSERAAEGVHSIIGFDGVVMTDSGGYQVLEYGEVDVSPVEIARFQELIGSDIAVPLDKPTGLVGRKQAEKTVEQTLQNVRMTMKEVGRDSRCVWVAPIQGGVYTDLIERCVDEYKEMGFSMYCLGSPTPLMTTYKYEPLVGMISAARLRISFGKPLHLFGAGHPMLFSLAVALGCDLFDSASYALFALEDRYMLSDGTVRLEQLSTLPCSCKACQMTSVRELQTMPRGERFKLLSWHNLNVCFQELRQVRQAIWEGRLFELLEKRARAHPALYEAFQRLTLDESIASASAKLTPLSKKRGLFLYDRVSLRRPEVRRAMSLLENFEMSRKVSTNAVLIDFRVTTVKNQSKLLEKLSSLVGGEGFEIYTYGTPYGLVPFALSNVYPYSQTTFTSNLVKDVEKELLEKILETLRKKMFKRVLVVERGKDVYPGFTKVLARLLSERLDAEVLHVSLR